MKKATKNAPRKTPRPRFDIESVPLDARMRIACRDPYHLVSHDTHATIQGTVPTALGYVLFRGVKSDMAAREMAQFRFIWNGRLYLGDIQGHCPGRDAVAQIAERFALACTRVKAQNVDGAKGILK